MSLSEPERQLCEQFLEAMLQATFPLQEKAADREVTLEALIEAAELLKQRFEQELEAVRQELAE